MAEVLPVYVCLVIARESHMWETGFSIYTLVQ